MRTEVCEICDRTVGSDGTPGAKSDTPAVELTRRRNAQAGRVNLCSACHHTVRNCYVCQEPIIAQCECHGRYVSGDLSAHSKCLTSAATALTKPIAQ